MDEKYGGSDIDAGSSTGKTNKNWKQMTPEEVKENVREKVAKGVAAFAGAIKGFTEEAKQSDLAKSTREAIERAGDTTREIASTAKSEFRRTKDEMTAGRTGTGHEGMGLGGSQLGGTGGSTLGGSSRVPTSGVPDLGPSGGGYATDEPLERGTQKDKTWKSNDWKNEP